MIPRSPIEGNEPVQWQNNPLTTNRSSARLEEGVPPTGHLPESTPNQPTDGNLFSKVAAPIRDMFTKEILLPDNQTKRTFSLSGLFVAIKSELGKFATVTHRATAMSLGALVFAATQLSKALTSDQAQIAKSMEKSREYRKSIYDL